VARIAFVVGCSRAGAAIASVALLVLACGCASNGGSAPKPVQLSEDFVFPSQVAVLPFVNRSSDPDAGRTVRKLFYNFFSSLNYNDVELAVVDETLKKHGLYDRIAARGDYSLPRVCDLLGVDGIIRGEVTRFGKNYALLYTDTQAGLRASFVHCRQGQTLWELSDEEHLREGNLPTSLPGLALALVNTYLKHSATEAYAAASNLCMRMVGTIPNPSVLVEPPPRIRLLVHNGAGQQLLPGEVLRLVLLGEPGQSGEWDLGNIAKRIPLTEVEPGAYAGEYVVGTEDRASGIRIRARLKNREGAVNTWTDLLGEVSLGEPTLLPPSIESDTLLTAERSPYWVPDVLVVKKGVTLTIKPGVTLRLMGVGMVVRGTLKAVGGHRESVRFLGMGDKGFKGIFLDSTQGESLLSYCEVQGGQYGLNLKNARVKINKCLFENNDWGVVLQGSEIAMQESVIRLSTQAGLSARASVLNVSGSVISENKGGGLLLDDVRGTISGNNIYGNAHFEAKNLSQETREPINGNWWGFRDVNQVRTIGNLTLEPLLAQPIDMPDLGN
jgi:hypothetical protein